MEAISQTIQESLSEGHLACGAAFAIARRLTVDPLKVGEEADAGGVRLSKCQLGLFGYGSKEEGTYRRVKPMADIPPSLARAIEAALDDNGDLSCAAAWGTADQLGVTKQTLANAAEGLDVRIVQCQLGAF